MTFMRDSDFPGAFRAISTKINETARGGSISWLSLIPSEGQQHSPLTGDIPVALMVRRLPTTPIAVISEGELIVGFVRLATVPGPTELQLENYPPVTLGGDSGSFVFAHADRFMVPRGYRQETQVKTKSAPAIGTVVAFLDDPERFDLLDLLENGAHTVTDEAGSSVIYVSENGGDDPVEIPNMRAIIL